MPKADLNVITLPKKINFEELREYSIRLDSTCIFTLDSGEENALS